MFELERKYSSVRIILPPIDRPRSQQAPKPKKVYSDPKRPTTAIDRLKMLRKLHRLIHTNSSFGHGSTLFQHRSQDPFC